MQEGRPPQRTAVGERQSPLGRVENKLDIAVFYSVHNVRPTFRDFIDLFSVNALFDQEPLGPAGRDHVEAKLRQRADGIDDARLVDVPDGNKYRAGARQPRPAAKLALDEGNIVVAVDAHDLTGRLHLRSEHGVDG